MKGKLKLLILKIVLKSNVLCRLYYLFFSGAYDREFKSVISGMIEYRNPDAVGGDGYLLRRNTHRLEKGLIMRPRKPVFALDYIEETLSAFLNCWNRGDCKSESLIWSKDVICKYFETVSSHPLLDGLKVKFYESIDDRLGRDISLVPYPRSSLGELNVSYDQLYSLAKRRRSVRWFSEDLVMRESIDKAIMLASLSPSACNRQPFRFLVFDRSNDAAKLLEFAGGTAGFSNNVPAAIAVIGELSAYKSEADRHLIYIDGGLSTMALCFALETLGLSSCCINWPDIEDREVRLTRFLRIKDNERVVMLLAVGVPDGSGGIPYSQKKSLDEIREYR